MRRLFGADARFAVERVGARGLVAFELEHAAPGAIVTAHVDDEALEEARREWAWRRQSRQASATPRR